MSEYPNNLAFPLVWKSAERLLNPETSWAVRQGFTGLAFKSASAPSLYQDVTHLLVPGLHPLGIEANLVLLPEDEEQLHLEIQAVTGREGVVLLGFEGAKIEAEESWEYSPNETPPDLVAEDNRRALRGEAIVLEAGKNRWRWQTSEGTEFVSSASTAREYFQAALCLRRTKTKGTRLNNVHESLERWLSFALACPYRSLTDQECDREQRGLAADFLEEVAGRSNAPIPLRWRRASVSLRQGNVRDTLYHLCDASLRRRDLPPAFAECLLQAFWEEVPALASSDRNSLVYMARAGNQFIKVLALNRLFFETEHRDARKTIDSFRWNPDSWLRAIASHTSH